MTRASADRLLRRASHAIETLEDRLLLAATPFISEFMAQNATGLSDMFGERSDWIELYNPSGSGVDLGGMHLTDNADDLEKWTFPAGTILPAGSYRIVFASGRDITTGVQLHTNFSLAAAGGYLGLVAADGVTVLSQFDPYPEQRDDISYGMGTDVDSSPLLATGNAYHVYVPTDNSLGTSWRDVTFDDSSWTTGAGAVGYDVVQPPPRIAGFSVQMVDVDQYLNDIATATNLLNGNTGGFTVTFSGIQDYTSINHGTGGDYTGDQLLPDGLSSTENYALRATADLYIPAGTWTLDVGSDDGFSLRIPGVTFTNRVGESNPLPFSADTIVYSPGRGHSHTSGTITVGAGGLSTQVILDYYQGLGGQDVELSFAGGTRSWSDGGFQLLQDGLSGWQVKTTSSTAPPNYNDIIKTDIQGAMFNNNASAYIRIPIPEIANPDDYDTLQLRIRYDDGFVAWINGTEFARRNAPAVSWNTAATSDHPTADALQYEDIVLDIPPGVLHAGVGQNELAIQGLNISASDTNFLIQAELNGLKLLTTTVQYFSHPTPGALNDAASATEVVADTKFSADRGFYTSPFQVQITSNTPGATIRYTTDGTWPSAVRGTIYTGLIPITGTTILRAIAYKTGAISTNVDTETYIFLNDVIQQSPTGQAPANFPASWSPNVTDYGMDPNIVNNAAYSSQLISALEAIPTMSLVMDVNDLFGSTGIYSNPSGDGITWERPGSLELIYPDGTQGFQVNLGVRIRGGFSRSTDNPKHAFRFFFRNQYGPGHLDYPLFGPDGQQSIDSFDLRTFQNYSWSFQGDSRNIFMRDVTSRDAQGAMGWDYERGNYYHLYINGQYWGIFNTDERPEADYGSQYYGGSPDDYDVVKPAPDNGYSIYATDGNLDAWSQLWNGLYNVDLTRNANYFKLMGLNPDGSRNSSYPILLDVDNLIDYMLVIFYGGNLDAPLSNFLGNSSPNNFFAMRNRNGTQGWQFFAHDAEHTLLNVNEDRTGPFNTISTNPATALAKSNPQYMFQLLEANAEFRLRVADRVHKWMFNDSVLTPAGFMQIINARRSELGNSIIGESARWGDAKREPPLNFIDYTNALNGVTSGFVPNRTSVVLGQLRGDGLYPALAAPETNQNGGTVADGFQLSFVNSGGGTIYYTLDGTDPRMIGGAINPGALVYSGAIAVHQAINLRARMLYNGTWSALTEWDYFIDLAALRITELNYNPPATPSAPGVTDPQSYEFVELMNTGTTTLNLLGAQMRDGITFDFPDYELAPGARAVIVQDVGAFQARYGTSIPIIGTYSGKLSNGGETLTLRTPDAIIEQFTFKDGWYPQTDGDGFTLVAVDPRASNAMLDTRAGWRSSNNLLGAPGAPDPGYNGNVVVINELMANTTGPNGDWVELKNTTAAPIDISGWFLSNDAGNLAKYQIQPGTVIPAGGLRLFTQTDNFGNPQAPGVSIPFSFSSSGGDVYLTSNSGSTPGGYREHENFSASPVEISYGFYTKSTGDTDFTKLSAPTFGTPNAYPLVGPVVISELMYAPVPGADEFIELQNLTAAPVSLFDSTLNAGWTFVDGVDFTFPAGASIPASGYALVVPIDPELFRTLYQVPSVTPIYGPYAGALDNAGEKVKIARPATPDPGQPVPYVSVDHVEYGNAAPWPADALLQGPSLARKVASSYANDPSNWVAGPIGGTPGFAFMLPEAPSNATATALSNTTIRLSWTDNSTAEQGFRIAMSVDGVSYSDIGEVSSGTTYFDISDLQGATLYYFNVRSYNVVGDSILSNPTSAFTYGTQSTTLIGITDAWQYNQSRTDLGTAWIATGYNDSQAGWSTGNALFYNESSSLPAAKNTLLNLGPTSSRTPTYYFRTHFTINSDPSQLTAINLRLILDDSAAVYINGNLVPAFTLRMPSTWSYSTFSGASVGNAGWEGPFGLNPGLFVQGDNVIAVEVHQGASGSNDIVFGAELTALSLAPVQTVGGSFIPVAPDPTSVPVDSIQVVFDQPVTGVDWADFRLSRNGGPNMLTAAQTVTASADNKTFTIGNLNALTWIGASYDLQLVAGNSGIRAIADSSPLGADVFEHFVISDTIIVGTAANDSYYMRLNGSVVEIFATGSPSGTPKYTAPASDLADLTIDLGGGNDTFNIAGTFSFTPVFVGGAGADTLLISAGNPTIAADLKATAAESVTVTGGNVTFASPQHLTAMNIISGQVTMAPGGSNFLRTNTLTMSATGALMLEDNDLLVTFSGTSPYSNIRQYIINAVRGLNGPTIHAASDPPAPGFVGALAPIENSRIHVTNWDGETISNGFNFNQVIVKYTYQGDANADGRVTADDYRSVIANMGHAGAWIDGDIDLDGTVTAADFALVTANMGAGAGGVSGPELAVAPAAMVQPAAQESPAAARALPAGPAIAPAAATVDSEVAVGRKQARAFSRTPIQPQPAGSVAVLAVARGATGADPVEGRIGGSVVDALLAQGVLQGDARGFSFGKKVLEFLRA